ncbi:MAG TPA: hypothetical protein VFA09_25940 [Ktedonobacteraceae bacterium]|nr:hypothetical protein [Ktedonobacteraceae bacterium]
MPIELETTIITVIVALIVGLLTAAGSYIIGSRQLKQNDEKTHRELELELNRLREEQKQWITNLQSAYELEKYKARITSYPEVFTIIGRLSHKAKVPATAEHAKAIAEELNEWLYSTGGMVAEPGTRGALLKLRDACFTWNKRRERPDDLYKWRSYSLLLLRNDLGIKGLESFDYGQMASLIERVKEEVNRATQEDIFV